jgi:hypothetical protein
MVLSKHHNSTAQLHGHSCMWPLHVRLPIIPQYVCRLQVVSNYEGDPPPQLPIPLPPPVYSPGRGTVINENEEAGQSAVSSVATLCNSAVGAGVLSLPFAFRHAGRGLVILEDVVVTSADGAPAGVCKCCSTAPVLQVCLEAYCCA